MKYFPFLRGKQNELLALRELAANIADNGNVIPIVEPVNSNGTTQKSITRFMQENMSFIFICNPIHGDFPHDPKKLEDMAISLELSDYGNWIPALYIRESTAQRELEDFLEKYDEYKLALIYYGRPQEGSILSKAKSANIKHHIFVHGRLDSHYVESIPLRKRVIVTDQFHRQNNADYPDRQFFTDWNTSRGNKDNVNFGDFSIVGDYFQKGGSQPYAVALHHIHFKENSYSLDVSHFKSDRRSTKADPSGKIAEAVRHLVDELDYLVPNDTQACDEYRAINKDRRRTNLGRMKGLAIKHHLEVMLSDDGLSR